MNPMSNVLVLDQLSKSSATNLQPRKRASAQTTLAFVTAAAAFVAMAGTAQAQDCVNGYRMVKDEVPVACSIGHFGRPLDTRLARTQVLYRAQVLYTQFGCFAYDGRRLGELVGCNY